MSTKSKNNSNTVHLKLRNYILMTIVLLISLTISSCGGTNKEDTALSSTETQTSTTNQHISTEEDGPNEVIADAVSKTSKNGFDSSTNRNVTIGDCALEIPEYFGENNSADDSTLTYYAERGVGCTMLSVYTVDYNKSEQEFAAEKDQLLQAYISGMGKAEQISIQDVNIEKKHFTGSIVIDNNPIAYDGRIDAFLFNKEAYVILLIQSRESQFDYFEDFEKIKTSMTEKGINGGDANVIKEGDKEKDMIEKVISAIQGDVGEGEKIKNVTFKDGDLCVYVDLGEEDNKIFSREQIAVSRVSSITDSILEIEEYYEMWDTVTVDFGELGRVTNSKKNIHDDGYGKYFMPPNGGEFVLTETGEQPENNSYSKTEATGSISIDDFATLIESVLNQNPSLNSTVSHTEDTVNVDLWADGLSNAAALAAIGEEESINSWEEMKTGVQTLAESLSAFRYTSGAEDYNVVLNVLNDLDKTKVLLTYKNGELVYDAVYE